MNRAKTKALVEAALFIASSPIEKDRLQNIAETDEDELDDIIEEINEQFDSEGHGFELFRSSHGFELRVKPELLEYVSHLTPHSDLSRGPLKVLALVAFKQPIKQSTIAKIIGNRAYSYIKDLENRDLIKTEKHGRTKKLMITKEFKKYFGIEEKEELVEKLKDKLGEDAEKLLNQDPE